MVAIEEIGSLGEHPQIATVSLARVGVHVRYVLSYNFELILEHVRTHIYFCCKPTGP